MHNIFEIDSVHQLTLTEMVHLSLSQNVSLTSIHLCTFLAPTPIPTCLLKPMKLLVMYLLEQVLFNVC